MNILYLHTHDTGRILSTYGYRVPTPNYQRIFRQGLTFENAFAVAPTCSPSRAGLLTGCFPHQNGMLGLAQRGFHLNMQFHIVPYLKAHGYHTVLCGVQHEYAYYLDHALAKEAIGYDEDISTDCSKYAEADLVLWDQNNASKLLEWLDHADTKKPFFLSFGQHATHRKYPTQIDKQIDPDYAVPPAYVTNNATTRDDFARFETSLKIADENLGKIYDKLIEKDLLKDTIILITTDHGIAYPFSKCTLFDRGIGVLMAMLVPGGQQTSKVYDGLVSHIDVFPTLCDLLGLEKPDHLEGKSFAALFEGKEYEGDDYIFAENNFHTSYEPYRCIRNKRYKYIKYFDDYKQLNLSNIDNSPIKEMLEQYGLRDIEKSQEYLFDLIYDPCEQNNLADEEGYQQIKMDLENRLQQFMVKTNDPLLKGPLEIKPGYKVNKRECYSPSSKNPDDYVD